MPLVRFPVRNEFALGQPELYKGADRDDVKAVLDGVAVAGLVGVLRQIGDLAEFAAEVFHGLQEQVMTTASRSHNLKMRLQRVEAAISPLEKVLLVQTSHLHFAYTAGSEYHPRIQTRKDHFINSDLPQFIMDPYEECRDPPRLYLLDKFDTGGSGSCLKRYSDPTFFRRASDSSSEEIDTKKANKSKRKKSSHRTGEPSRVESISNHSSRIRFASTVNGQNSSRYAYQIVSDQTSASQTASIVDVTGKSDSVDHLSSFSSRTGSAYIKCILNSSSSMQPEQNSKEESPRLMDHKVIIASEFPVAETQVADDNSCHNSSLEQSAPSFSSINWDEKAQLVESEEGNCNGDEVLEMKIHADAQVIQDSYLTNADQMNISSSDVAIHQSISSRNEVEEIESEPENYMDALNTIESESEYDRECHTKQEVEQYLSDVSYQNKEYGMQQSRSNHTENPRLGGRQYSLDDKNRGQEEATGILSESKVDHDLSTNESPAAPSISSNVGIYERLPDSVPSENFYDEQMAHTCDSPHSPAAVFSKSSEIIERPKEKSVFNNPSSSGLRFSNLQVQPRDGIPGTDHDSQNSHNESPTIHSIGFWTNGGILGLEPSKPPDFAASNAGSHNYLAKNCKAVSDTGHTSMTKCAGPVKNSVVLVQEAERIQELRGSCNQRALTPIDGLDGKLKEVGDSCSGNCLHHALEGDLSLNTTVPHGQIVNPDVKFASREFDVLNDDYSTVIFGLGNRLLRNGFHKNLAAVYDRESEAVSLQMEAMEHRGGHENVSSHRVHEQAFKEKLGRGSRMNSLLSSPPLEHMRISFKPTDGFETSKLRLKFPDGNHCQESIADLYASFQLIPEPGIPLRGIHSDSDDDTFFKSSPCLSDDCHSSYSGSNSGQWETYETPEGKDAEIYDAFRRISLVDSAYRSEKYGESTNNDIPIDSRLISDPEKSAQPSVSVHLFDFPSFDVLNTIGQEKPKYISVPRNPLELLDFGVPIPQLPPPPPLQWCVSKTPSDLAGEKKHSLSEYENQFDMKLQGTTMSLKPQPASANGPLVSDEQPKQKKLHERKEANEAASGNGGMDGKEDLLQQIRTKSFNLRPIATAKPRASQVTTTSAKVTTILEKANAIRQAVGSDDGEDDTWSDT